MNENHARSKADWKIFNVFRYRFTQTEKKKLNLLYLHLFYLHLVCLLYYDFHTEHEYSVLFESRNNNQY